MIKPQLHLMLSPIEINFESSTLPISQPAAFPSFDAVNFAYRLNKLSTFLPAAYELLSLLYECKYIISTKKTIRLLELARKTLERAGIILYSFASCPETFVPYKKAYIDLLKMLQANCGQENIELQGRIQILLIPLNSNFSIQRRGSSIRIRSTSLQRHSRATSASFCSKPGTRSLDSPEPPAVAAAQPASMLPPDAFPPVIHLQSSSSLLIHNPSIKRPRSPLWDYRQFEKPPTSIRKRRLDQENIVTQSGKYRPPKKLRQFGIYCTGKSSMGNLNSFRRSERQTFVL